MVNMFNKCFRLFVPRYYSCRTETSSVIEKKPILYGDTASPPVRFVLMTASALGIDIDYREIDLFAANQKTEFYKKINPLQKVPTLVVQDQAICDSHAISMYLCQMSGDKTLYSNDAYIKARIDDMLFFNSGTLFPIDSALFMNYFAGKWPVKPTKIDMLTSALDHLEFHLNKNIWLTGDEMYLSDICLMATVTSIYQIVPKQRHHKKVNEWLKKCETLPFYEINKQGLERLQKFIKIFENYNKS